MTSHAITKDNRPNGESGGQSGDELERSLGLFSAATIVAGSMIGSGIFLVTPEIARYLPSAGAITLAWIVTGIITVLGATSYGKLAAHMPKAGGQYVFLKESWGELPAFLYGWILFTVIQTGFLAAVAVAFAKYLGILVPAISAAPIFPGIPFFPFSSIQVLAILVLVGLTVYNSFGIKGGALLQNVFTSLKVIALLLLIATGLFYGGGLMGNSAVLNHDWSLIPPELDGNLIALLGVFAVASVGPLFSADAWNYVTFIGGEVKDPRKTLPKALIVGSLTVVILYVLVNLAYLNVLSLDGIQHAPEDRVATEVMNTIFGPVGTGLMASMILISTFGCLNGLLLAGARVFYAMAKDNLLFKQFADVNPKTKSPNFSLWAQCAWAAVLALSGTYSELLGYIVFASLLFYIVTMAGLIKLGRKMPDDLQMKTTLDFGIPIVYIVGASYIAWFLLFGENTWRTSMMGVGLVAIGLPIYFIWTKFLRK